MNDNGDIKDKKIGTTSYASLLAEIESEYQNKGISVEQYKNLKVEEKWGNKIYLGIVGTGDITITALKAFREIPGYEVRCVMSRDLTRARFFAGEHQIPYFADNVFNMLMVGCNVFYVANKTEAHFQIIKYLLHLGAHVICEKPLTVFSSEFFELIQHAKWKNVLLMEAWKTFHLPIYKKMLREISKMKNGEIVSIFNPKTKKKMKIRQQIKSLIFEWYAPIKKSAVFPSSNKSSLLVWTKNFCDYYYYLIIMAVSLLGPADLSSFNIESIATGFTSTYAFKCGWISKYSNCKVEIVMAALYNEGKLPQNKFKIIGSTKSIIFDNITQINTYGIYDTNNNLVKNHISKFYNDQNYRHFIPEFTEFLDMYKKKDFSRATSYIEISFNASKIMEKIFRNTFNLFSQWE